MDLLSELREATKKKIQLYLDKIKVKSNINDINIETPPDQLLGDFAFPCFSLSKQLKKNPNIISKEIAEFLSDKKYPDFSKIISNGPYVNFYVDKNRFVEKIVSKVLKEKSKFGSSKEGKKANVCIDMSSPNIAKPFGVGHLRSTIIGNSIAKIAEKLGYNPVKINYLGDWGTQFGKLIVGYKRWGEKKKLEKEPIKHLLELYVKANDEQYDEEARRWFKKLEDGDKEALMLWKKFRYLSLKEFKKLYKLLNIKFDVISGESYYNNKMGAVINELKEKKLLENSDGALVVNLEKYNLGVCLIQKSDGATLYTTREIAAAIDRYKKYKFAKMIYEVGQEQQLHFKQVFKILELMGYPWAKDCVHVYHGLYLDKDGKKFSTRKGKVVYMEDVLKETIELAKRTIENKNPSLKSKEETARKVAVAAIFYGDLKNNRQIDMVFDIEKFLDFEGDTGPYLQYSYVRAKSILKKSKKKPKVSLSELSPSEYELAKKIAEFPEVVKKSYSLFAPNIIANYAFQLSQIFSSFYHENQVIGSETEEFRLALVEAFAIVIKESLSLLGIDVLEEM